MKKTTILSIGIGAAMLASTSTAHAAPAGPAPPAPRMAPVVKELVFVGGQVKKPGPVEWAKGLTIFDAVKAGGGATVFGDMRRVKLIRDGKIYLYDLTIQKHQTIPLEANDVIEVPVKPG